jgi:hypothetical protein
VVAWVFFRAHSMAQARDVLAAMFGARGLGAGATAIAPAMVALIAAGLLWANLAPNTWEIRLKPRAGWALVCGLLLGAAILTIAAPSPFLYFQF